MLTWYILRFYLTQLRFSIQLFCFLGKTQCSFSQIEQSIESKVKSDKTYSIILWSGPNQEVTKALFIEFDADRVKGKFFKIQTLYCDINDFCIFRQKVQTPNSLKLTLFKVS